MLMIGGGVVAPSTACPQAGVTATIAVRGKCAEGPSWRGFGWMTRLSAPAAAGEVPMRAPTWMARPGSPSYIRPRANLEFWRWPFRFARSRSASVHRASVNAITTLTGKHPNALSPWMPPESPDALVAIAVPLPGLVA